jgi:hypothetical protein
MIGYSKCWSVFKYIILHGMIEIPVMLLVIYNAFEYGFFVWKFWISKNFDFEEIQKKNDLNIYYKLSRVIFIFFVYKLSRYLLYDFKKSFWSELKNSLSFIIQYVSLILFYFFIVNHFENFDILLKYGLTIFWKQCFNRIFMAAFLEVFGNRLIDVFKKKSNEALNIAYFFSNKNNIKKFAIVHYDLKFIEIVNTSSDDKNICKYYYFDDDNEYLKIYHQNNNIGYLKKKL